MGHSQQQTIYSLEKNTSVCLKGIFAVMVLLHHFQQRTSFISDPFIGKAFELLGFLSVSVFMFFSGFGLMLSYERKGEAYIREFLKSRILPLYLINVLLMTLSTAKNALIHMGISTKDIVSTLFLGKTLVTYGWYIQTILLFYLLYFAIFRLVKKDAAKLILLLSAVALYILVSHIICAQAATYISSLSFAAGLLFGKYSEKLTTFYKHKIIVLLLSMAAFSMLTVLSLLTDNRHIRYFSRVVASPLFIVFLLVLTETVMAYNRSIIVNKVTRSLGSISLEIYVSQGFLFDILRSDLVYINNHYIYLLLVTLGTFVAALLFHPVFTLIFTLCKKKADTRS